MRRIPEEEIPVKEFLSLIRMYAKTHDVYFPDEEKLNDPDKQNECYENIRNAMLEYCRGVESLN